MAGHGGDEGAARALTADPDASVRAAALGALARLGAMTASDVSAALADADPGVRRRACTAAIAFTGIDLVPLLADADDMVVEAAAWALGERGTAATATEAGAVDELIAIAGHHREPLCREAAVAALGAIGDPRGLAAILAATKDRPAIRRRAVIALAPFDGPEVDAALAAAREDRDWQVRQAAEDLSDPPTP